MLTVDKQIEHAPDFFSKEHVKLNKSGCSFHFATPELWQQLLLTDCLPNYLYTYICLFEIYQCVAKAQDVDIHLLISTGVAKRSCL